MKAGAIYNRGTKRDLIDAEAICSLPGWSMRRFLDHASRSFPLKSELLARAFTYFDDAERQPMPLGCTADWEQVKANILKGVREWERTQARGRGR